MAKLYILWQGRTNNTYAGMEDEHIIRAFREKEDMIAYIHKDIWDHTDLLSEDGYFRVPKPGEFVEGNEINYAYKYSNLELYYKFETCELE